MGASRSQVDRRPLWRLPVVALSVALLILYGCWQLSGWPRGDRAIVGDVFFYPIDFMAVVTAWGASRRCRARPRLRLAWRLLAVSFAAYLAGDMIWTVYEAIGSAPYPSVGDIFYLAFYPFMLWGLLLFGARRHGVADRVRTSLDLAVVAIAGLMLVVYVVLGPTIVQSGPDPMQTAISIAYPVGDVVLLVGLASVLLRSCERSSVRALALMGGGLCFFVAGDLVYGWLTLNSNYAGGGPADWLYMISITLFALAGAMQRAPDPGSAEDIAKPGNRAVWTPSVAVAVCFGLLLVAHSDDRLLPDLALLIASIIVATLVSVRQFLAQRDLIRTRGHVAHQASHDALTGLPNRAVAIGRVHEMVARAQADSTIAALSIDIDDFKHVNERFGHAAGDEMLRVIATRLTSIVRDSDLVARLGGDEFIVLIDVAAHVHEPELVAERICKTLAQPIQLGPAPSRTLSLTASIGIAVGDHGRPDEILRDADLALQEAKASGKGRWVALGTELQHAIQERHAIQLELKDAVRDRQLFLVYQPILDLRSLQIVGVEALLRWRHPVRGIVPPDRFITLAEDTGQIVEIGRWVVQTACQQAAAWQRDRRPVGIWVNVSARQLEDDEFVQEVADALRDTGLWPAALTLEITETTLMRDPASAAVRLHQIKALGARVAVDDFGAGHSSLLYLRQFPADVVKIDRSFISGMAASERTVVLTHTLVQLGKTLRLQTLGEGIEDWSQLERLQHEQCDLGQGFLFARPAEAEVIGELLVSDKALVPIKPVPERVAGPRRITSSSARRIRQAPDHSDR